MEWSPTHAQVRLLDELAALIEVGGAERLLDTAVVNADERDFPEPWHPSAAAIEGLLRHLARLAHLDIAIVVDGERSTSKGELRTELEWLDYVDGTARFLLGNIGSDNVAGHLTHALGQAAVAALGAAVPYRDDARLDPSPRLGSLCAIYLGLGVLATNAAHYRHAWNGIANTVHDGGLHLSECTYTLAVQRVVRGAEIPAHATLGPLARDEVIEWVTDLTPHRAALVERLGLDARW